MCEYAIRTTRLSWRTGVVANRSELARRWPRFIGFRSAQLLLERGRVAYGAFAQGKAQRFWTRTRVPAEQAPALLRLSPEEMLAAMRASGGPIAKRPDSERVDVNEMEAAE
jgi:hypothetical protein